MRAITSLAAIVAALTGQTVDPMRPAVEKVKPLLVNL
jgi:hypothetical protein